MSKHTPTTDEVREVFCTPMSTAEMIDPDAHYVKGEWFDRWLVAEVAAAKAEAWEEGWEAAIDQAPGDVWFDEWHYQSNPYCAERATDDH